MKSAGKKQELCISRRCYISAGSHTAVGSTRRRHPLVDGQLEVVGLGLAGVRVLLVGGLLEHEHLLHAGGVLGRVDLVAEDGLLHTKPRPYI